MNSIHPDIAKQSHFTRSAIFAEKVGMISYFDSKQVFAVTVLKAFACQVIRKKTLSQDGYKAVLLNYGPKAKKSTKPVKYSILKHVESAEPKKYLQEVILQDAIYDSLQPGDTLNVSQFAAGHLVDVTSKSIGKGFAGVMKRHNFAGLEASHGVSISHRSQGSTGGCQDPGRVFKGKKMAGQLGNQKVTVQNLVVVKVDMQRNLILVKGAIPGAKGNRVFIRNALKKS